MNENELYPWIVWTKNGLNGLCERCLKHLVWEKPQTLGHFAQLRHEFMLRHRECKEKK